MLQTRMNRHDPIFLFRFPNWFSFPIGDSRNANYTYIFISIPIFQFSPALDFQLGQYQLGTFVGQLWAYPARRLSSLPNIISSVVIQAGTAALSRAQYVVCLCIGVCVFVFLGRRAFMYITSSLTPLLNFLIQGHVAPAKWPAFPWLLDLIDCEVILYFCIMY